MQPFPPAHVRYVTDEEGTAGAVVDFVGSVLSEPVNAALVGVGGLALVALLAAYVRVRPAQRDLSVLRDALAEYRPFLPWMLRLAVGLPLLGAGYAGYFVTPAVDVQVRLLQVGLGFLLLFGLATRAAAGAALLLYLVGVVRYPALLLAGEYVGALAAIVLLGGGRPSADHLLARVASADGTLYGTVDPVHRVAERVGAALDPYRVYAPTAVRVTLGLTFAYLGVWEKLAHPERSLAVVAKYDLTALVPVDPGLWVLGAGLTELAIGVLLVTGLFTRAAAAAGFAVLTLTLFGLPDDPVLAHVTLFGLTSYLFVTGAGPPSLDRALAGATADLRSAPEPPRPVGETSSTGRPNERP